MGGGQVLNVNDTNVGVGSKDHLVNLQANMKYVFKCKTLQAGFDPYIYLYSPTGQLLAQDDDGDGFPNSKLFYTPNMAGQYKLKVGGFGGSTGMYNLTIEGSAPPPPTAKTLPFTDFKTIKPGDQYIYEFPVQQAGQVTFNIKPQIDAILTIKIYQNGVLVAQDQGLKTNFTLTWQGQAGTNVKVDVVSTDNLTNNCTISAQQGPGGVIPPPPPGGGDAKNLPFNDFKTIKPGDKFSYTVPVQNGQVTFNIKPQIDAILDIKIYQNGVLVAQDSGLKTNFVLNWQGQAGANCKIDVVSTDNLTNNCNISCSQLGAGGFPPPVKPLPPIKPPVKK
jgi:hypothetical protein